MGLFWLGFLCGTGLMWFYRNVQAERLYRAQQARGDYWFEQYRAVASHLDSLIN